MGEPRPPLTPRQWAVRIVISLLVGGVVTAISVWSAWQDLTGAEGLNGTQLRTAWALRRIRSLLEGIPADSGTQPSSLPDPNEIARMVFPRANSNGMAVDDWGNPLIIRSDGNSVVLVSHGRDGRPGGLGLDADLSTTDPMPPEAHPTFWQFVHDLPTGGIISGCVFSGVLTMLLTLLVLRPTKGRRARPLPFVLAAIALTVIVVTVMAGILATLHIPVVGH